jgi:hypothetical protein
LHPILDVRPWPRVLLRYPLLILTACLLGALCAFTYSYAPLHRAKDWRITYLQDRLEIRNAQIEEFEVEIADARGSLEGQPSSEEVEALRAQLDEATKLADSREREMRSLDKKLASAKKSRDSYKGRHASAVSELKQAKSAPPPSSPPAIAATDPPAGASKDAPEQEPKLRAAETRDTESSIPASPAPVPDTQSESQDRVED